MKTKLFEVRDKNTFVVVMATWLEAPTDQEAWLLRRAGFGEPLVQLTAFNRCQSHYDVYEWKDRTYQITHDYISKNFHFLKPGAVIDVEFILGESSEEKISERETYS